MFDWVLNMPLLRRFQLPLRDHTDNVFKNQPKISVETISRVYFSRDLVKPNFSTKYFLPIPFAEGFSASKMKIGIKNEGVKSKAVKLVTSAFQEIPRCTKYACKQAVSSMTTSL